MKNNNYYFVSKISALLVFVCIIINSIILHATENKVNLQTIISNFNTILYTRGWNTEIAENKVKVWKTTPAYTMLEISISTDNSGKNLKFIIDSKKNGKDENKTFIFTKGKSLNNETIEIFVMPYLISLTERKDELELSEKYFSKATFGYYRTNETKKISPETDKGMFFIKAKFTSDPMKNINISEIPLYVGDLIDLDYSMSYYRQGETNLDYFDETAFSIDLLLYGKHSASLSGTSRKRNIYGIFTNATYYRPFLKNTRVLWNEEVYTDHIHIQYCYWLPLAFRQDMTQERSKKILSMSYKIGIGPGQNSSLTATGITEEEEDNLNPIFRSNWYGLNGHGDRRHNYYYSITLPINISLSADGYLNSKFEMKYDFYYFLAIQDLNVYDFLNKAEFNYGFYITKNTTAGFGYEYYHIKSIENDKRKTHHWNRLKLQMEIKF